MKIFCCLTRSRLPLVCLFATFLSTPVFAQEAPTPEPRGPFLTGLYGSYIAAQIADVDSTRRAVSVGLREGNGLMRGCVQAGLSCTVPLKIGITAGILYSVDRFVRPMSKQAAIATMFSLTLMQSVVSGRNYALYFTVKGRQR